MVLNIKIMSVLSKEQSDRIKFWLEQQSHESKEDITWYVGLETYKNFQKLLFESYMKNKDKPIEGELKDGWWAYARRH
jgi:hypothetical protein